MPKPLQRTRPPISSASKASCSDCHALTGLSASPISSASGSMTTAFPLRRRGNHERPPLTTAKLEAGTAPGRLCGLAPLPPERSGGALLLDSIDEDKTGEHIARQVGAIQSWLRFSAD